MHINLIGISGVAKSGKDTLAAMIKVHQIDNAFPDWMTIEEKISMVDSLKNRKSNWEIRKFAGKLKEVATMLTGITDWEDQVIKETPILGWNMSRREFLQRLGTDAIRDGLHTNAWVMALMSDYNSLCKWIVTDVRFPNEAEAIKNNGGILIRVNKSGITGINNHISETALDDYIFDFVINNNGNLSDMYKKIKAFDFI